MQRYRTLIAQGAVWIVVLVAGTGPVGAQNTTQPAQPSEANRLASQSLLYSAENLFHSLDAPARAGRLVAIVQYLDQLSPGEPQAQRFLSDVYQTCGDLTAATTAAQRMLEAHPDDYAACIRWLRFRLEGLHNTEQRVELIRKIMETPSLPTPLRAEAAAELASLFIGKGANDKAKQILDQALKLDPLNHTALIARLRLADKPTIEMRVNTMLALLKGNPRAFWVVRELAVLLGEVGLGDLAMQYYAYAWRIWWPGEPVSNAPSAFAAEYLSVMLDAGQYKEAIKTFEPALRRLNRAPQFQSLMIEAYRANGDNIKVKQMTRHVEGLYKSQVTVAGVMEKERNVGPAGRYDSAQAVENLGWYYLLVERHALRALRNARKARSLGAKGENIDVLMGCAQLRAGQVAGLKLLKPLINKYAMAAAFVAEYDFEKGDGTLGKQAILAGLGAQRKGLAFRTLSALATKHGVKAPPAKDAATVKTLLAGFDPQVLQMGAEPGKFFKVRILPLKTAYFVGEPVLIQARLTNVSKIPISIGSWGLVSNRMGLKMGIEGRDKLVFWAPVAIWPAPRYLPAGQSITTRVRLDVGPLAEYLSQHPLENITLNVSGILNPVEMRQSVVSALLSVTPPVAIIRRDGLVGAMETLAGRTLADHYNASLRSIERLLGSSRISARMLAARRVASLLAWIRQVELKKQRIAASLQPVVKREILISLLGRILKDPAPVVRAEVLAAMEFTDLDPTLRNQLSGAIKDPSPLVRFRLVELLGASELNGDRKVVETFLKDPAKPVRTMARSFVLVWRKADRAAAEKKVREDRRKSEYRPQPGRTGGK